MRVLEASMDDAGHVPVSAVEFANGELTDEPIALCNQGQLRLADVEGGTQLEACNP